MPYTYYNFWFLPKYQQEYADKYLLFNDISDEELKVFEDIFTKLIDVYKRQELYSGLWCVNRR